MRYDHLAQLSLCSGGQRPPGHGDDGHPSGEKQQHQYRLERSYFRAMRELERLQKTRPQRLQEQEQEPAPAEAAKPEVTASPEAAASSEAAEVAVSPCRKKPSRR